MSRLRLQVEFVNQYVKANIGAHVIYDDDIKSKREIEGIQVTEGPKLKNDKPLVLELNIF
jgi:hypothetical protein